MVASDDFFTYLKKSQSVEKNKHCPGVIFRSGRPYINKKKEKGNEREVLCKQFCGLCVYLQPLKS